jgi:hypothetical protein
MVSKSQTLTRRGDDAKDDEASGSRHPASFGPVLRRPLQEYNALASA